MKEEKSWLEKYVPPGIPLVREVMLFVCGITWAILYSFSFGFKYLSARISSPIRFSICVHLRVSLGASFPNPLERVMPFPSCCSSIPAPIMTGYEPPQPYSLLRKSTFYFEDKLF